jgi:hypothetical protein
MRDGVVESTEPEGLTGYVAVPFWKWFANIAFA